MLLTFVALLAFAGSAPSSSLAPATPETTDGGGRSRDLSAIVALTRGVQEFQPKDRFTAPPDQSAWSGEQFRVELPVRDHLFLGWSYDVSAKSLLIRIAPGAFVPAHYLRSGAFGGGKRPFTGYVIHEERRDRGSYRGANAFGATTTVRSASATEYALAELPPFWQPLSGRTLEHRLTITPDEARLLTPHLRVVYEGRLAARGGHIIECYEHTTTPTLSNPKDVFHRNCVVSVELVRISVVDGRSGAALTTWESAARGE